MRVYILVIISQWKFPILLIETMTTQIVLSGRTHTVPPPVAQGTDNLMQQRVVGINCTAFAHRHVMWRIKTRRTDITDASRLSPHSIHAILTSKGIAVVLYQPEPMCIAERTDCFQVKRISKRMCNHNCLCLLTQCLFQLAYIQIILWNRQIQKNRNCTILQIWSNRGRKTCRNRDDFIPTLHTPLSQKWRSQCHKRQQICRRPGIDKRTKTHTNIIRKFLFKLFCISA